MKKIAREKTDTEMARALCDKIPEQTWVHQVIWRADHDSLVKACKIANINLEAEECGDE